MKNQDFNKSLILLGSRIREIRRAKGWSQEQLAFECSLDRSYIGGVERGERNISFVILCKIATALSVDLCVLTKDILSFEGDKIND